MTDEAALRRFLTDRVFAIAEAHPEILSLNVVGSFADTDDLSGISDIDTVIIVDYLTEWKYRAILESFEAVAEPLKERFGYALKINHTFGPLKYNEPDTVVYHVMIYDVARHILHCRNSPFTCYDWQRTRLYAKSHLSEIYQVRRLMPSHFFGARRSAREYLADYDKAAVSYRYYRFLDGEVIEEKASKPMADKDRWEFAFHILRFIMGNFLKMLEGRNAMHSHEELLARFTALFPESEAGLPEWFRRIKGYKSANAFPPAGPELDAFVRGFLAAFEMGFHRMFPREGGALRVARHERTALNDGKTFVGRTLDAPILPPSGPVTAIPGVEAAHASPSLRARETAALLAPGAPLEVTGDLAEIDYGQAEGRDAAWLAAGHPGMIAGWTAGEDPRFPGGENHADVCRRVDSYLERALPRVRGGASLLAVTHNVWIRCLMGRLLGIAPQSWFRIAVPHGKPFLLRANPLGGFLPDLSPDEVARLLAAIETSEFLAYQGKSDPDIAERHAFWKSVYAFPPRPREGRPEFAGTCLIPMAGEGSRFSKAGFTTTKPLINVHDAPMIYQAVSALPRMRKCVYAMRSHVASPELKACLDRLSEEVAIVPVDKVTEGQACTCLLGLPEADPDAPLLIAPCDNGMIWSDEALAAVIADPAVEVVCWTFSRHLSISAKPEAWGYIASDASGNGLRVSVKRPLTSDPYSEDCIIGTFWFRSAALFGELARELIARNLRVNNEFYVDSVIGLAIDLGRKVKVFRVDKYLSWGKPEDLFEYRKWMELEKLYDH